MVNRLKLFVFLAVLLSSIPVFAQEGLYFGGGLSVLQPTNNFGQDDYGFKTVAQTGGGVNASAIWFLNPQISLGAELGYAFVPRKKSYWSLLDKRGDYKVNYQMANLVALGSFYFNGDDVKPYLGVAFGAYYLRNLVDFDDKNTTSSVSYTYRSVHPGYGPEAGMLIELNKKQYATIGLRYTFIPNIDKEDVINGVTKNPHGKQNHWGLNVKIFFGR